MGDRYILELKCAFCMIKNIDIYYAPTCGIYTFTCSFCKNENKVVEEFKAQKIKKKKIEKREAIGLVNPRKYGGFVTNKRRKLWKRVAKKYRKIHSKNLMPKR